MTDTMRVVFDVDGCLIDSCELIRQSYREAGVEAPEDILAYEGIDWLGPLGHTPQEAAALKKLKNLRYLEHVSNDGVSTLPPYVVACRLANEGHTCYAYTGAPHGTLNALADHLPHWPFWSAYDGVTTPERMLRLHRIKPATGVYVDDQSRLVDLPRGWRFVHYTGQDADELYQEIVR